MKSVPTTEYGITAILREHIDKHGLPKSTRKILQEYIKDVDKGRSPSARTQQLVSVWLKSIVDDQE